MDPNFKAYILSTSWQAFLLTFTHMGTTALAVGAGWAKNTWKYYSSQRRAMTEQARHEYWKDIRSGLGLTLFLWFLLFLFCCFEAGYQKWHSADGEKTSLNTQLLGLQEYAKNKEQYDKKLVWSEGEVRHWREAYEGISRGQTVPDRHLGPEDEDALFDQLNRIKKQPGNAAFSVIRIGSIGCGEPGLFAQQLWDVFWRAHWNIPMKPVFTPKELEILNQYSWSGITIFSDDASRNRGSFVSAILGQAHIQSEAMPFPAVDPKLTPNFKGTILWVGLKK